MNLEEVVRWLADALAYITLAVLLYGAWRSSRRRALLINGQRARWLAIPWFYLITTLLFFGLCFAGWQALPIPLGRSVEGWLFAAGSLLYFAGVVLALWGRLELGHSPFVSPALTTRLLEQHELIMTGPFAIVRHPMYLGFLLAAAGSVPMYFTWTTVFFMLCAALLLRRIRIEERVLALEFGDAWMAYCARVPMLIPRLFQPRNAAQHRHRAGHHPDIGFPGY